MSTRRLLVRLLLLSGLCTLSACDDGTGGPSTEGRPNVVLLLIDDMGINDVGFNGSTDVRTPHIDQLAAEGVYFSRHYTDSTCAATRAGILTGTEPARHGFRPEHRGISPEVVTLPEALREVGYSTHHIGKWHLGYTTPLAWPTAQGFDTFEGFLHQWLLRGPHEPGHFNLKEPTYQNPWLQKQDGPARPYKGHLSRILTDRAVEFIASRAESNDPWFLNLWLYAPHTPLEPQQAYAANYPDTPRGRYLAMVEQADATVGAVMAALERYGQEENTLVLVASDNGGAGRHYDSNYPLHGTKATYLEGGVRAPLIVRWPGQFPAGKVIHEVVSNFDYYPTIAAAAGAHPGQGLIGQDLARVVQEGRSQAGSLAWETVTANRQTWSVLSADGRWRLFQFYLGEPRLFDLEADPTGREDVIAEYPQVAADLTKQYLRWRQDISLLDLDYQAEDASGRGRMTGMSLQRSPGFGGFSFAIELQLDRAPLEGEVQVVALQEEQWQITVQDGRLILDMDGQRLRTGVLELNRCTHVVATAHYRYAARFPDKNKALLALYVDGQLVAGKEIANPEPRQAPFLAPTYIGQDASGERRFAGRLVSPQIYNDYLVSGEDGIIGNGVEVLMQKACTDPQHWSDGTK